LISLPLPDRTKIIKKLLPLEQSPAKDILTPEQWKKVHEMAKEIESER